MLAACRKWSRWSICFRPCWMCWDCPRAEHSLDGQSFAAAFDGELSNWKDSAIIDYMGEGPIRPMRCIRRGCYKYVYVDQCPPLLFDLQADPLEQHNLAGQPSLAKTEACLREQLLRDYDPQAVEQQVLRSQQDRLMMFEALSKGKWQPWAWPVPTPGVVK